MNAPYPLCQAMIHLDNGVDIEPLGHHCSKPAEKYIEVGNAKIMLCAQCAAAITGGAWERGHATQIRIGALVWNAPVRFEKEIDAQLADKSTWTA